MTNEQLNIVNSCISYGSAALNSKNAQEIFSSFGTSFRDDPWFTLHIMTQATITHPTLISWLDNNGHYSTSEVIKEHSLLSKQQSPDFNKLCGGLIEKMKDSEDIVENVIIASAISSFFSDGASLAIIYLNKVMGNSFISLVSEFGELRLWMLLFSALWNCDFDGFRDMALPKIN